MDSLGGNTTTILLATLNPLSSTIEESISTLKFATWASKIKVYSKANEFDPKDDALIKWLWREVMHLKDILHMRNHGSKNDINLEILTLKEENHKLKELAEFGKFAKEEVQKLETENLELK